MKGYIAFVCFLFFGYSLAAQYKEESGKFFVHNYSVDEHMAEAQTWAAVQDDRGVMYFGNNAGVLEFDGNNWRLIPTTNRSVVRSLAVDSTGTIYVGGVGDFGYLAPDSIGSLNFYSLSHLLDSTDRFFKEVWMTCASEKRIYFSTVEGLYEFNPQYFKSPDENKPFKIWSSQSPLMGVYYVRGDVITREPNVGLVKLNENSLELIPGTFPLSNALVWTINPIFDDKLLISARGIGLLVYDPDQPINNRIQQPYSYREASSFLVKNNLYYGSPLENNHFVYGTLRKGAIVVDQYGDIKEYISEDQGLASNNVVSTYYNKGNLWLASHKSIANIELRAPYTYWDETLGLTGIITDMIRYDGILFVATTQGVYYLQNHRFAEIPNIQFPAWDFIIDEHRNNKLLIGTTKGIFEIKTDKVKYAATELIAGLPYIYDVFVSEKDSNIIYAGSSKGFFAIHKNRRYDVERSSLIYEDIREIREDAFGNLWLATRYNGVIQMVRKQGHDELLENKFSINRYNKKQFGLNSLHGISIRHFKNQLLFLTASGVYEFNDKKKEFQPSAFAKQYLDTDSAFVHKFFEDEHGNCWVVYNGRSNMGALIKQNDGSYNLKDTIFNRISDNAVIRHIYVDDKATWIAATKGLYKFNSKAETNIQNARFNTLIRSIKMNNDSLIFFGSGEKSSGCEELRDGVCKGKKVVLNYENNSIVFEYSATYFSPETNNMYSFCLQKNGEEKLWSPWTKETKKEYTNLYEGEYTFLVKSKNIYGVQGETDSFRFTVLPPLYRTVGAYIFYIIATALFFYLVAVLYSRRLKSANIRLEKVILERTSEINQQKEEIQTQNENLEQINAELRKLSVVASNTDNAVIITNIHGDYLWVNEGFKRIYGYNLYEFKEKFGENLIKTSSYSNIEATFKECIEEKKSVIYSSHFQSKSGNEIWTQTTLTPILNENEEIESLVAIDSDITKIKEAEKFIEEQRDEIKVQRDIAIKQKNEITDSIEYAKHIQNALLPSENSLQKILNDYFVLNRPKSIVSGDFCWAAKKGGKIIFAVADCTGHGVPGALMSMLGVTFLNKIILEKGITDTSEILNLLRANIIESLHQTGTAGEASDGMDIAMAAIDLKTKVLQFSGAMNPLLLIRKNEDNDVYELIRLKHDIMPIAINQMLSKKYTSKSMQLLTNDTIYMFSDGYTDQYGGEKGVRLNFNRFKNLILSVQDQSMSQQKRLLENELEKWMGEYAQIDDILVLGMRLNDVL